jgi:hypothetical protein
MNPLALSPPSALAIASSLLQKFYPLPQKKSILPTLPPLPRRQIDALLITGIQRFRPHTA